MNKTMVKGRKVADVTLYALSTCAWCKKTKRLLNQLGVEYRFIDVDLLSDEEMAQLRKEIERFTKEELYPTVIINHTCIVGYKPDAIKEKLAK